jgi:hypothetical protein
MRHEYKNLGYTTTYLRSAWLTMLLCQSVLLIMGIAVELIIFIKLREMMKMGSLR